MDVVSLRRPAGSPSLLQRRTEQFPLPLPSRHCLSANRAPQMAIEMGTDENRWPAGRRRGWMDERETSPEMGMEGGGWGLIEL